MAMTMIEDRPTLGGMTVTQPPAPPHWAPGYVPPRPPKRGRSWTGVLAAGGLVVAVAALVVGIADRSTSAPMNGSPTTVTVSPPAPVYSPGDVSAAKASLCSEWAAARDAVKAETHRDDNAVLSRVALSNSAGLMDGAAKASALPTDARDAATGVAQAYRMLAAVSSTAPTGSPDFQSAVDKANQAADRMQAICS